MEPEDEHQATKATRAPATVMLPARLWEQAKDLLTEQERREVVEEALRRAVIERVKRNCGDWF